MVIGVEVVVSNPVIGPAVKVMAVSNVVANVKCSIGPPDIVKGDSGSFVSVMSVKIGLGFVEKLMTGVTFEIVSIVWGDVGTRVQPPV